MITVEINIPTTTNSATVAGFFARDPMTEAMYLVHDGGVGGGKSGVGQRAFLAWSTRAFDEPDRLDITRTPNRHLSFGDGPHFCAGAALARMEGRIAIPAILARFLKLGITLDRPLVWKRGAVLPGFESLPVSLV